MDLKRFVQRTLFASRWLLVPLYFGLALLLVLFSVYFFRELWHLGARAMVLSDSDLILAALSLIDLVLVAGLVVMVMLSGYENFVARLDIDETEKTISWLGKLDTGSLKLKVATTIVAISSIELLKIFMEARLVPDDKLLWMTLIQLAFVVSAVLLALMDRLAANDRR